MRGIWLENLRFSMRDNLEIPQPQPGEALIRVRIAGICATDLEMGRGYYPYTGVAGHEFVGEVVSAPKQGEWEGRRVVGEINIACGKCAACRANRKHHCSQRRVLGIKDQNGTFAEFLVLPIENLHQVPDTVPDEAAVFTEPLAAALEIQEQVHIHPEDRVILAGAGRLGQLIAQTLALTGCDLRVLARHPEQVELLRKRRIKVIGEAEIESGWADIAVEATGSEAGFRLARRAVRPAGTIVLKSTYKGEMSLDLSPVVVDEIRIVGSRCGPFPSALRLLESGMADPLPLIAARYGLSQGVEALQHAGQPGVLKVLVDNKY